MQRSISAMSLMLMATTATAAAQPAVTRPGPFTFTLSAGPSRTFRGVDAPGVQGQGGIAYSLGRGFRLSLEGASHWYEAQPTGPCLIQDAQFCYQTIRRALGAGMLSATYYMSRFREGGWGSIPYVITGVGMYRSRRIATRYSDCQPGGGLCDANTYRLEMRDTQFGWSGGAGLESRVGRVGVFAETRVHYIYDDRPDGEPSNDYFLWPLAVGIRF